MVRSMTGYAQAAGEESGWRMTVTLKALNHRFLDLRLRLPAELSAGELRLRAQVRESVRRGHLDVEVHLEPTSFEPPEVDRELLRSLIALSNELRREFKLRATPDLATLLRLPGVLHSRERIADPGEVERLERMAEGLLGEAIEGLDQMRRTEGASVERALRHSLQCINSQRQRLVELSQQTRPHQHQRLQQRLQELLGRAEMDPARLAEEAAYLADRSDVTEELTRLASHTEQFERLLASPGEIGKRLDFLLQEMNRETNTLLSKTPGLDAVGLEMTGLGLEIKAEIERLREQVQNVE